jgi:hypothetical protein
LQRLQGVGLSTLDHFFVSRLREPGAVIRYHVNLGSFKNDADGRDVSSSFEQATEAWAGVPATFKRVADPKAADFTVVYRSRQLVTVDNYPVYATSFFPNSDPANRRVKVYSLALQSRHALVNVFCHEIGHVLGLRYEFAALRETSDPSVQWGLANPESVMNYYTDPLELAVHHLDVDGLCSLYAFAMDSSDTPFRGYFIAFARPAA